jgi:hypothetical protein
MERILDIILDLPQFLDSMALGEVRLTRKGLGDSTPDRRRWHGINREALLQTSRFRRDSDCL